jgi:hypothetical protein
MRVEAFAVFFGAERLVGTCLFWGALIWDMELRPGPDLLLNSVGDL